MNKLLPILFNTEMILMILCGRKTATRRLIKKSQCLLQIKEEPSDLKKDGKDTLSNIAAMYEAPYQPGDILYVKETFQYVDIGGEDWNPRIPMKRHGIFLKVLSVRAEKLQDITSDEVRKEGIGEDCIGISACGGGCETCTANMDNYVSIYSMFWNSTNIKMGMDIERYGYEANPWVWRIEFERCEKPKNYIILKIIEIVKENLFLKGRKI